MSTLFRRLAAQQLGTPAPRIRPRASLPYQSAPAMLDTPLADELAPPAIAPPPAARVVAPRHPNSDDPIVEHGPAAPRPSPGADITAAASRQASTIKGDAPPAGDPTPLHAPEVLALGQLPTRPTDTPPTGSQRLTSRRAESTRPSQHAQTPGAVATGSHPEPSQAPTATSPWPRPLVPTYQPPSAQTAGLRQQPASGASTPQRGHAPEAAPDEIHVHIGRIEVTAVSEAPKPKARAARGQAPMSLDDYLAKRQRGGA